MWLLPQVGSIGRRASSLSLERTNEARLIGDTATMPMRSTGQSTVALNAGACLRGRSVRDRGGPSGPRAIVGNAKSASEEPSTFGSDGFSPGLTRPGWIAYILPANLVQTYPQV